MKNTQQKWLYGGAGLLIGVLMTVLAGSVVNTENLQGYFQFAKVSPALNQVSSQINRPSKINLVYPSNGSTVLKYYSQSNMCDVTKPGPDPKTDPYCLTFSYARITDPKINYLHFRVWDSTGKIFKDSNYLSPSGTTISTWDPAGIPNGSYSWKIYGNDSSNATVAESDKYTFTLETSAV